MDREKIADLIEESIAAFDFDVNSLGIFNKETRELSHWRIHVDAVDGEFSKIFEGPDLIETLLGAYEWASGKRMTANLLDSIIELLDDGPTDLMEGAYVKTSDA